MWLLIGVLGSLRTRNRFGNIIHGGERVIPGMAVLNVTHLLQGFPTVDGNMHTRDVSRMYLTFLKANTLLQYLYRVLLVPE